MLARDVYKEFQQAKEGSMVRQRIIEMIARLTVQVTNQDLAKPKDKEEMTLEELEAEAAAVMARGLHSGLAAPQGPKTAWPELPQGS